VEPRQILRSGITASALAHVSCLLLVIFFTEVHPFGSVTAEPIAVDIVAPDEVAQKPEEPELPPKEKEKPSDFPDLSPKVDNSAKPAAPSSPPAAPPPAAAKPSQAAAPQKQAALTPPTPAPSAASTPVSAPVQNDAQSPAFGFGQQPAAQQAPLPAQQPAYMPAQPDLSVKYGVVLGLPQDKPGDGFDAAATEKADVGNDAISQFRRHVKTCATLPKSVAPSDKVAIKLRVLMTPDGRLGAEPTLIEASASMKGPLLMQSAISALQACQPYTMLPADHYREWKVLDLTFTPQDLTGAS
jgi:hypothetical protein